MRQHWEQERVDRIHVLIQSNAIRLSVAILHISFMWDVYVCVCSHIAYNASFASSVLVFTRQMVVVVAVEVRHAREMHLSAVVAEQGPV